jgi:hypothetical protein
LGFRWRDTELFSESEASSLSKLFDVQKRDGRGTYSNGDGQYFVGNWLNQYEGRIYEHSSGQGIEFWAMNMQRYTRYRAGFGRYDDQVKKYRKDLAGFQKSLEVAKKSKTGTRYGYSVKHFEKAIKDRKAKLEKLAQEGPDKWAARTAKWERVRKTYPDVASFIERKFGGEFITEYKP